MAGPFHGKIECNVAPNAGTGSTQSLFVNMFNFFQHLTGTNGVKLVAYHTGAQGTGMLLTRGMGYYNDATGLIAGENAWACFRFQSASVPFDVLIQWSANTAFGTAPGNPALLVGGAAAVNTIGVAFAQRVDGGAPWNGSSGSNGFDTKGTPVWFNTSSCWYAPRSNDAIRGGAFGTTKQNMMLGQNNYPGANVAYRASFLADNDNVVLLLDVAADNTYENCMFGSYTPISGLTVSAPYFCFGHTALSAGGVPGSNSTNGDVAGTSTSQGGIPWPNLALSGTCSMSTDFFGSGFFTNAGAQPNRAFSTQRFDEWPFAVGCNETPFQVGLMGFSDFIRVTYNMLTHDTDTSGTRAIFGSTTQAEVKMSAPWPSGTVPGSGITMQGIDF